MSHHGQNRSSNRRNNFNKGGNRTGGGGGGKRGGKDSELPVDENNPVVQCFREYASELDEKHDRYERIVKCSRDITIESKRIIFLLHTVDAKKCNLRQVCDEAKTRLQNLCSNQFAAIAKELQGLDPYQFARAYTAGLQEFIEAYTFHEYVSSQNISHWKTIQDQLRYKASTSGKVPTGTEAAADDSLDEGSDAEEMIEISCHLSPMDFVLGVGDLTGELMRKCINSLGSGDVESCFEHCQFLKKLYNGFISVGNARNRDFSHKLHTLRQSLLKSENVCYNVKVRGGEAAKWGNTDDTGFANIPKDLDDDEGVFF
ncbi:translin-associated protein X [Toxorhynchites rutilus septentrionalis]|uniref:translin-associated protein X n=1 Tax=Toxorhynchites rutilus septentrionalis TaxID=329112 RepID=UPI00247A7461|nr:translin-associated protein X [Toxorhynchites rutilus septentrionalis]